MSYLDGLTKTLGGRGGGKGERGVAGPPPAPLDYNELCNLYHGKEVFIA